MSEVGLPDGPRLTAGGLGEGEVADLLRLRQHLQSEFALIFTEQETAAARMGEIRRVLADIDAVVRRPPRPEVRLPGHIRRRPPPGARPPVPPPAPSAIPLPGRHLRYASLAVLLRAGTPLPLTEIHRALHLAGYVVAAPNRVKALADALGYEHRQGRARRASRGVYGIRELSPWRRRQSLRGYPVRQGAGGARRTVPSRSHEGAA